MERTNELFFELLQVALGNRTCLSRTPSEAEWGELYAIAEKQAVSGVLFAGVERLPKSQTPDLNLLMDMLGQAEYIRTQNEEKNKEVVNVWNSLEADGFKACIMKGQSLMGYYPEHLRGLRQCGDIDVLVDKDDVEVLRYAFQKESSAPEWSYKHVHLHQLNNTSSISSAQGYIDLHYRLAMSRNLWRNRRIQRWCRELKRKGFVYDEGRGYATLRDEDNIVFLLLHALWHFLFEGVGLRQLLDLYFVLQKRGDSSITVPGTAVEENVEILRKIDEFGLRKFASACSWVMWYVFEGVEVSPSTGSGTDRLYMGILPKANEKEGRFLLKEIMATGNFGHEDERKRYRSGDSGVLTYVRKLMHYTRLLGHYPTEFLWLPVGTIYIRLWNRKIRKVIEG